MSDLTLRRVMGVIAFLGLGVASYLTVVHYTGAQTPCIAGGDCETVQHSIYSKLAGVPVPLLGVIGYLLILGSLLLRPSENARLATVVLTFAGFGFSCYLTGREVFTLEAICPWCVSSAVMMTLLFGFSVWRFLRGEQYGAPEPGHGQPPQASLT